MLVRCNLKCKYDTSTNALLDVETNEVVCEYCGDILNDISEYAKKAMKSNGDIVRKKKGKAFAFDCLECKKQRQVIVKDGNAIGKGCDKQDCCKFNISEYMKHTISNMGQNDDE